MPGMLAGDAASFSPNSSSLLVTPLLLDRFSQRDPLAPGQQQLAYARFTLLAEYPHDHEAFT